MMPVLIYEAKFIDLRRLSRDAIFRYDIARCVIRKLGWRRIHKEYGQVLYCRSSTYLPTYLQIEVHECNYQADKGGFKC